MSQQRQYTRPVLFGIVGACAALSTFGLAGPAQAVGGTPAAPANAAAVWHTHAITTANGSPATTYASSTRDAYLTWTAPADGGSPITGYTVAYSTNNGTSWTSATPVDSNTTNTTIANLRTAGSTYQFRVAAVNANGASTPVQTAAVAPPDTGGAYVHANPDGSLTTSLATPANSTTAWGNSGRAVKAYIDVALNSTFTSYPATYATTSVAAEPLTRLTNVPVVTFKTAANAVSAYPYWFHTRVVVCDAAAATINDQQCTYYSDNVNAYPAATAFAINVPPDGTTTFAGGGYYYQTLRSYPAAVAANTITATPVNGAQTINTAWTAATGASYYKVARNGVTPVSGPNVEPRDTNITAPAAVDTAAGWSASNSYTVTACTLAADGATQQCAAGAASALSQPTVPNVATYVWGCGTVTNMCVGTAGLHGVVAFNFYTDPNVAGTWWQQSLDGGLTWYAMNSTAPAKITVSSTLNGTVSYTPVGTPGAYGAYTNSAVTSGSGNRVFRFRQYNKVTGLYSAWSTVSPNYVVNP